MERLRLLFSACYWAVSAPIRTYPLYFLQRTAISILIDDKMFSQESLTNAKIFLVKKS
jgi:hypothetical protein